MRTLNEEEKKEVTNIMVERHPLYYNNSKLHDIFPTLKVSSLGRLFRTFRDASSQILIIFQTLSGF